MASAPMPSCCSSKLYEYYICYSYGFCYADNRYDSLHIKLKLNVTLNHDLSEKDGTYEELLPHIASREDMLCAEDIRLKFDALNLSKPYFIIIFVALLAYLRTVFKSYYSKNHNPKVSVLLTKPKDVDYEIFILKRYRGFCQHMLNKKEGKTGKLEEDLILLKTNEINWMRRMSVVYRSEKKKILHTNIDLCNYLLSILVSVKGKQDITIREFNKLCFEKSFLEKEEGLIRRWVHNGDPIFSEEDQFFRRRLALRQYLKDVSELIGVKEELPPVAEPLTFFDRIISREVPADIIYEDEFCIAFRD